MKKKILIVGTMNSKDVYERPIAYGFEKNNCIVNFYNLNKKEAFLTHRLRVSFFLKKINNLLITKVENFKPDIIFFWRSTTIIPKTIKTIKQLNPKIKIILYHNDNPYTGIQNILKNRHFLNSIKYADITAGYRPKDLRFIKKLGAKKIKLLKPNYISYLHKPINKNKKKDVIFIGHYTSDRANILNLLYHKKINFEVYGPGWKNIMHKFSWGNKIKGNRIVNQEYVKKISESKIAISFLSKKNKDVYTRRCFEIPACGTLLLAPKTKELKKIFKDKKEAIFWSSDKDFISQIIKIINNNDRIKMITKKGLMRLKKDGHSEIDRAKEILNW